LISQGISFCFETVFSHDSKIDFLARAKANGYTIILVYIHLFDSRLNEARVKQRISEGGHRVPIDKIHSRIPRTLQHIKTALSIQVCRKRRLHLQIHPFGDFVQHGIRNQNLPFSRLLLDSAGDIDRRPHHPLNVINIRIPSLKERPDDIPLLAQHFLTRCAQKNRKRFKGFTPVAMAALHP
jgi:hypothetical protein